ncbi:MAG: hypothetical protein PHS93_09740 [Candidatus Omnitrophica bacterium]|nr:hypothetical protein [Candidatus Omnitrophota bacterium]
MKKDPAFLFYPGDASNDTQFMNRLERGAYFDLVKSQRLFHGYSTEQLRKVLGKDYDEVWSALELILQKDDDGFFIGWVRDSINARAAYTQKQSDRINKYWDDKKNIPRNNHGITVDIPVENENEITLLKEKRGVGKKEKPEWAKNFKNFNSKGKYPNECQNEKFAEIWDSWCNHRLEREWDIGCKKGYTWELQKVHMIALIKLSKGDLVKMEKYKNYSIDQGWKSFNEYKSVDRPVEGMKLGETDKGWCL